MAGTLACIGPRDGCEYAEEMPCFVGMGAKEGREGIQIIGKDMDRTRKGVGNAEFNN